MIGLLDDSTACLLECAGFVPIAMARVEDVSWDQEEGAEEGAEEEHVTQLTQAVNHPTFNCIEEQSPPTFPQADINYQEAILSRAG